MRQAPPTIKRFPEQKADKQPSFTGKNTKKCRSRRTLFPDDNSRKQLNQKIFRDKIGVDIPTTTGLYWNGARTPQSKFQFCLIHSKDQGNPTPLVFLFVKIAMPGLSEDLCPPLEGVLCTMHEAGRQKRTHLFLQAHAKEDKAMRQWFYKYIYTQLAKHVNMQTLPKYKNNGHSDTGDLHTKMQGLEL